MTWSLALVIATAAHLGFQLTITALVYPALLATPATTWVAVHTAHSRRIVPLVAVLYAALLVTAAATLLESATPAAIVAAVSITLTFGLTATAAVRLHARLRGGRDEVVLRQLITVDRLRTLLALTALIAAALT